MLSIVLLQTLRKHTGKVWCVSWHPNGEIFASCGEDKDIRIWGPKNDGNYVVKMLISDAHSQTIREIAWSPKGDCFATASFDKFIIIWSKNESEYEQSATLEFHENEVKSVTFSNSEPTFLASCGRDRIIGIWNCVSVDDFEFCVLINEHRQDVKRVKFNPYSEKPILASASYDNTVKLYTENSDEEWTTLDVLQGHSSTVWSMSFDKNSRIVTCSADQSLKFWHKVNEKYQCFNTLENLHDRPIFDVDWCPLSNLIATASGDNSVKLIIEDKTHPYKFDVCETIESAHDQDVNCVKWNPVKKGIFLTCSDDGSIKIWKYNK